MGRRCSCRLPIRPSEPELARCVDGSIALYASRFAVMPGTTLEQRNRRYLELYRDAVKSFCELALPRYRYRPHGTFLPADAQWRRAFVRELTAHAGVPVITASAAIDDALTALRGAPHLPQ
jgi:hypothetical protein